MDKKPTKAPAARAAHLEKMLDEALEETFPASDPVAIHIERDTTAAERAE